MSSVGADQSIDGSGPLPALHRISPRGRHTQWTEGTHCISSVGPSRSDSLPSTSACVTFISRISVDKKPQVLSPSVSRLLIHHFRLDVHACVHRIVHELSMRERAQSTDEPAFRPPHTCGAAPAHGWSGPPGKGACPRGTRSPPARSGCAFSVGRCRGWGCQIQIQGHPNPLSSLPALRGGWYRLIGSARSCRPAAAGINHRHHLPIRSDTRNQPPFVPAAPTARTWSAGRRCRRGTSVAGARP